MVQLPRQLVQQSLMKMGLDIVSLCLPPDVACPLNPRSPQIPAYWHVIENCCFRTSITVSYEWDIC